MGTEPVEADIPVERSDLFLETQEVFHIYDYLPAKWEGMSGTYLGKDISLLPMLFEQFNCSYSERMYAFMIIPIIDKYVSEDITRKQKSLAKSKGK